VLENKIKLLKHKHLLKQIKYLATFIFKKRFISSDLHRKLAQRRLYTKTGRKLKHITKIHPSTPPPTHTHFWKGDVFADPMRVAHETPGFAMNYNTLLELQPEGLRRTTKIQVIAADQTVEIRKG
jgi:hypothetical protein